MEFLYDSGLAVGKTSSEGFKALEAYPSEKPASASASGSATSSSQVSFCYIYIQLLILYLENWLYVLYALWCSDHQHVVAA